MIKLSDKKGYIYTAASIVAASLMYILTKLAVSSVNIYSLMGIYFSAAFLTGMISSKIFIKIDLFYELKTHLFLIVVLSSLTIVGAYFWFLSIDHAGAATTSLLAKLQTIFTIAAGVILLKERFAKSAWVAVVGTIIGSVLVVYKGGQVDFQGVFWMSIFSVSYALQAYLVRRVAASVDMIALTVWRSFFIALFFLSTALIEGNFHIPQTNYLIVISIAGIMGAYLSKGFQYLAFRHLPISTVSVLTNGESVLTLILAAAFLNEHLSLINISGGVLIIVGAVFLITHLTHQT
ncbi:MAG: DMT family transporter [Epsilonproteobacteria bacterium]|nr:DMT family transporter [Campylobacterota bacterium]